MYAVEVDFLNESRHEQRICGVTALRAKQPFAAAALMAALRSSRKQRNFPPVRCGNPYLI
jgi:hypothetical protein